MRIPEVVATLDSRRQALLSGTDLPRPGVDAAHPRPRHRGVRGFVSAMRGCSNRCSYCIVPDVRGPETSRPAAEIATETAALAKAGAREVTLLGQNIDAYGSGGK